ncbi:hypothetical protein Z043_107709 [Scleropages formosus]|uniref:AIG1-type G domain-containing protein n=1 Tax=Scleropages formosus TaxID=113540 RepID=A0A0P7UTQ2_SCLFO|nr:hypothetical protein Z043_107709 [Scleropages formosus]
MSLVLLGERLTGKSTVGNAILGMKQFETGVVTRQGVERRALVAGKHVTMVDTPGCTGTQAPLLVVPIGRPFAEAEWRVTVEYLKPLQGPVWDSAIVLFTRGAQLRGRTIWEYVKRPILPPGTAGEMWEQVSCLGKPQQGCTGPERLRFSSPTDDLPHGMEMALVLLGRRGSGKSFAANTILGQAAFRAGKHTTCCVVSRGTVAGRRLLLVNAPGWSLFGLSRSAEVREEVACSPFLCPQGPSTFLLTVPVDHFKEQDRQAVEVYMGLLGEAVWQHTLVLFTWGDELRGQRIQEHVKRSGPELQSLLRKCGHRHHVFNK